MTPQSIPRVLDSMTTDPVAVMRRVMVFVLICGLLVANITGLSMRIQPSLVFKALVAVLGALGEVTAQGSGKHGWF